MSILKRFRRKLFPPTTKWHTISTSVPVGRVTVERIESKTVRLRVDSYDGRAPITSWLVRGDSLIISWHLEAVVEG